MPFVVDPQKKLAAEVQADLDLGKRIGIEHTPTIWVVTNKTNGVPFVEVVDRQRLYQIIDQALADTKGQAASPVTPAVAQMLQGMPSASHPHLQKMWVAQKICWH